MRYLFGGFIVLMAAGCGGGGGSPTSPQADTSASIPTASIPTNRLSGAIVKGPVAGANVCAFELVGTGKGDLLGCTTSLADGSYSLDLGYRGPVLVEAYGGSYTDEATGAAGTSLAATLRTAGMVDCGANTLVATPLTSMAVTRARRGSDFSLRTIDDAMAEVKTAFGLGVDVNLTGTMPEVRDGQRNGYGDALVGVSKMVQGGASLHATLLQRDLQKLNASYQACSAPPPVFSIKVLSDIRADVPQDGPAALVEVSLPTAAWRASLPSSGPMNQTSCVVTANSEALVRLSCAPTMGLAGLRILVSGSGNLQTAHVEAIPVAVLSVAGDTVVVAGGPLRLAANAEVYLDSGNRDLHVQGNSVSSGGNLDASSMVLFGAEPSDPSLNGRIATQGNVTLKGKKLFLGAATDAGRCTLSREGVLGGGAGATPPGSSGGGSLTTTSGNFSLPTTPVPSVSGGLTAHLDDDPWINLLAPNPGGVTIAIPGAPVAPTVRPNTNTCSAGSGSARP